MAQMWSSSLNNGKKIPAFGLGTFNSWKLGDSEVGEAVEAALKAGYRLIDCAHFYGNEAEIGEALQKCFKEGVVKRGELFITSKLWCSELTREDVLSACQLTLKNLQLDYIDLYLIHWPFGVKRRVSTVKDLTDEDKMRYDAKREANRWEGMEDLVSKGLAKTIGISNYTITKTERLLQTAKIVPAVNQVECHPYFQQQKLKEYCDSKGIVFEAFFPLGNPGRKLESDQSKVLDDPVIKEIAQKLNVTSAQVCISFGLHRGIVVIPKTVTPSRITENLRATEITLDAEDMRRLRGLDKNMRILKGGHLVVTDSVDEDVWDATEDEKFEVKQPEAKKHRGQNDDY